MECRAVVWALQSFRISFAREQFTVFTDQNSLRLPFNVSEPSGRFLRWGPHISKFNFNIRLKKR